MNEENKAEIKGYLEQYLADTRGIIDTRRNFRCFHPENHKHDDMHPSMSFNRDKNIVKCFACGVTYDIFSLYAYDNDLDNNKDFIRIYNELNERYNIGLETIKKVEYKPVQEPETSPTEDFTEYLKGCEAHQSQAISYLLDRGIDQAIIDIYKNKYSLGYDAELNAVIFSIKNTGIIKRFLDDHNKRWQNKGKVELFNADYLASAEDNPVIVVTEGIIDSMTIESIGYELGKNIKSVGLNSISNKDKLINEIVNSNYMGCILLALDNDSGGRQATDDIIAKINAINSKIPDKNKQFSVYDISYSGKDPNEAYLKDKDKLTSTIGGVFEMAEKVAENKQNEQLKDNKDSVKNILEHFKDRCVERGSRGAIKTGIDSLDTLLLGGFYTGVYILAAQSSLGKSSLALQLADNIAATEQDVLYISIEMSKDELVAKSLSRFMYTLKNNSNASVKDLFSTRDVLNGKGYSEDTPDNVKDLYNNAYNRYSETVADHLFINECDYTEDTKDPGVTTQKIAEYIKEHIKLYHSQPFVIVDYLQIIAANNRLTDKQAIDRAITELKRISRKYDISILVISSINRSSYNSTTVGMEALKESGGIEYGADYVFTLAHSELADSEDAYFNAQKKDIRELKIRCVKGRNGTVNEIDKIRFIPKCNVFEFK